MIEITNEDNMELMKRYPDNYFDLAIVDPPYSNDTTNLDNWLQDMKGKKAKIGVNRTDTLKDHAPDDAYWNELFRVSKHQIVWGVNWYDRVLGVGRIVWDKDNEGSNFSDCELAYKSINDKTDLIKIRWNGMLQYDMKNKEKRIHPTQKPIRLYEFLLMQYTKPNQKILDTHLGSGSIAIAVHNCNEREQMNLSLTACELDKEYYEASLKRLNNHRQQKTIFSI